MLRILRIYYFIFYNITFNCWWYIPFNHLLFLIQTLLLMTRNHFWSECFIITKKCSLIITFKSSTTHWSVIRHLRVNSLTHIPTCVNVEGGWSRSIDNKSNVTIPQHAYYTQTCRMHVQYMQKRWHATYYLQYAINRIDTGDTIWCS